jgi:hypothetical protein
MPITAALLLSFWDMECSFVFGAPSPAWHAGRAGARPDHPIPGSSSGGSEFPVIGVQRTL